MGFDPPKPLKVGTYPSATDFNGILSQLYALGRPVTDGMIGVEQSGYGQQTTDLRSTKIFIRITSQGDGTTAPKFAYGWNQVIDNGDGTYSDQPTDQPNAPWGTPTSGPAYEIANRTDVPSASATATPPGPIVQAWPGQQDGAAMYFSYVASSADFKVRLTAQCITPACGSDGGTGAWAADTYQEVGGAVSTNGPLGGIPLSGPGNPYCLYATPAVDGSPGNPEVGDVYTAIPNPKNPKTWLFTPKLTNGTCGGAWYADMSLSAAIQIQQIGGNGRCGCVPSETDDPTAGLALYVPAKSGWLRVNMGKTCCGCGSLVFRPLDPDAGTAELDLEGFHVACDTGDLFNKTLQVDCTGVDPDGVPFVIFRGRGTDACANEDPIGCDNNFRIKVRCLGSVENICTCIWCTQCCSGASAFGWWGNFSGFGDATLNGDWVYGYNAGASSGCQYKAVCPNNASSSGVDIESLLDVVGSGADWNWQLNHGGSIYQQTVGLWNCCSSNVMTKVSGAGPVSITLNPILANGECPTCAKTMPETVYVKILAVSTTGGATAGFTLGDVFALPRSDFYTDAQPQWCGPTRTDCGFPPYPGINFSCNIAGDGSNPHAAGCLGFSVVGTSATDVFFASGIGPSTAPPPPNVTATLLDCNCTGVLLHGTSTITCAQALGCDFGPDGSSVTYEFQVTDSPP